MLSPAVNQAIQAALQGRWEEAVEYNLNVLETSPQDIDALNRLAKAYKEVGKLSLAKKIYQQVLALDRYNTIAQKNLDKLASTKTPSSSLNHTVTSSAFLEEPGKTKTVKLTKIADTQILNNLTSAQPVNLVVKIHTIIVTTTDHTYLGTLPDDLTHRLIRFIKAGNKYTAIVRTAQTGNLTILIRELSRSKRLLHTPSFPSPKVSDTGLNTLSQ